MQHAFEVAGQTYVARIFPDSNVISVFQESNSRFIATYEWGDLAQTGNRPAGHWRSIHSAARLTLLDQLEPRVVAIANKQSTRPE